MTKVLYVEDNEDNIYMLKNRLGRKGFTVLIATDGAQGVAMAAAGRAWLDRCHRLETVTAAMAAAVEIGSREKEVLACAE